MENNSNIHDIVNRDENLIISYDTFIQIPEFYIFEKIRYDDDFRKFLKLDLFDHIEPKSMQPILLQRNEENLLKWLLRDEFKTKYSNEELLKLYEELYYTYDDMYDKLEFTDFAHGLKNMLLNSFTKKIIIHYRKNDERKLNQLISLYGGSDIIKVVTGDLKNVINDNQDYTLIIHDDYNIVKDIILNTDVTNKSFILPFVGYIFEQIDDMVITKDKFEIIAEEKGCAIGFMKPIKFDDSYFIMG